MKKHEKHEKNNTFLYFAVCAINIASFSHGVGNGWSSPVIPKLNSHVDSEQNPLSAPLSSSEESWLGSLICLGSCIGAFIAGFIAERIGRKMMLQLSMMPIIASYVVMAFAKNVPLLLVARVISGLGGGIIFAILPLYVGEIAEDSNRGGLGCFLMLFLNIGILFAYVVGPYCSVMVFCLICCVGPVLFLLVVTTFIPESPYYLVATNKIKKGEKALVKIRSSGVNIQKEFLDIKSYIKKSSEKPGRITDIFASDVLFKSLCIGLGLLVFQQLSAVNAILMFLQSIFEATGSELSPELSSMVIGAVQIVATVMAPLTADSLGRKILLVLSEIGISMSLTSLGIYFYWKDNGRNVDSIFLLPMFSLITYILAYGFGIGPISYAILGELFPPNMKARLATISTTVGQMLGFIVPQVFVTLMGVIGTAATFWIFAGLSIVAAIFVCIFVPETKGKSLEEIQNMLSDRESKTVLGV